MSEQTVSYRLDFKGAAQAARDLAAVEAAAKKANTAATQLQQTASKPLGAPGAGAGGAPSAGGMGGLPGAGGGGGTSWYNRPVGGRLGRAGDMITGEGISASRAGVVGGAVIGAAYSSAGIANLQFIEENAQRNNLGFDDTFRAMAGSNAAGRQMLEFSDLATGRQARLDAVNQRLGEFGGRIQADTYGRQSGRSATAEADAANGQFAAARFLRGNAIERPFFDTGTARSSRLSGEAAQDYAIRSRGQDLQAEQVSAGDQLRRVTERQRQVEAELRDAETKRRGNLVQAGKAEETRGRVTVGDVGLTALNPILGLASYMGGDFEGRTAAQREAAIQEQRIADLTKEREQNMKRINSIEQQQIRIADQIKNNQTDLAQAGIDRQRSAIAEGRSQATSFGSLTQFDRRAGVDALQRVLEVGLDNATTDDIAAARSVAPKKIADLQQASGFNDPLFKEVARLSQEDARVTDPQRAERDANELQKKLDEQRRANQEAFGKSLKDQSDDLIAEFEKFSNRIKEAIQKQAENAAKQSL